MSAAGFVVCAAAINQLTFLLSPVALAIIFFYSLTKRFTNATHFFLGLALAVAPVGAWIAQTGRIELPPLILGFGVLCWVAGFDLIYATQDYEFDRSEGLHSLVVRLGLQRSLLTAQLLHAMTLVSFLAFGFSANLGQVYFLGLALISVALVFEHRRARTLDIAEINRAFFQSNAFVSAVFLVASSLDFLF